MKKYLVLFSQQFSEFSAYRAHLLITLVEGFITPLFLIVALSFARPTSGITAASLVPYFLLIAFIYPLIRSRVDEQIDEMTLSGEVNNFLVRPLSFYKFMLTREFSWKLVTLAVVFPFLLLALMYFSPSGEISLSLVSVAYAVIASFTAFFLAFNFSYLIGLTAFWVDEFWALHNIKHVVFNLLSGVILPYSFFPDWFQNTLKYSPFYYITNWPVRILQGQGSVQQLIPALIWTAFLGVLVQLVQNAAINKYSFTGG